MSRDKDILQELRDMQSPLADMPYSTPYVVPVGYFNDLENNLIPTIQKLNQPDPTLNISKSMPHHVPEGYFESFSQQLGDAINEAALPKTIMPFTTPSAYFDTLPEQVLDRIRSEQHIPQTRTVPLGKEIWRQLRWAAAAILLLGIGMTSLSKYSSPQPADPTLALSYVSKMDISNYIEQNIDDIDVDMLTNDLSTNDVNVLTKQLNEDDITQYLDENGWDHVE